MSDSVIQINGNNNDQRVETSQIVSTPMDGSQSQSRQVCIAQQMTPITTIDVSQTDQNQTNEQSIHSSANSAVNVSISGTLIAHHSETQNVITSNPNISSVVSTPMSSIVSTGMSTQSQSNQSQQLMVSSSQPQMVSTSQSAHLNHSNAIIGQTLSGTPSLTSMPSISNSGAPQTVHITHQSHHHNTPILQTSVQPTQHNPMSVQMSQLPQVQVIGQTIGGSGGTYQFQQVYPQQMLLPGNLTIQNMPFGSNQGLSLQIPFTATNAGSTGSVPITSIASKPPIMSKGVAISPLTQGLTASHHMITNLKPNIGAAQQILKQVLPAQQFMHNTNNQTVVISQLLPHQNQHSMPQSILPATSNRTILESPKGKPFGTGSIRSSIGNKMLSHSGSIQPKSPILPASSSMSSMTSSLMNSHFKTQFSGNPNTTQLIATQTPSGIITNQPQILGYQMPMTWSSQTGQLMTQNGQLVSQNGSPIFIRGPNQAGEHMFIQTSSPQIQTVSMGTPINVHSSGTTMHMNAGHTHSSPLNATPMTASLHPISVTSNVNTMTTTTVNASQPTSIAPLTTSTNKPRPLRPITSVGTQTSTIAQKQHVESSTPPKPIAPAKPKPNTQTVPTSTKSLNKEQNPLTTIRVTTSVAATTQTQTQSQQTHQNSTKTDAANQTTKVSVATETPKTNANQVSSSRNSINDVNKPQNVKSSNSTNTINTSTSTSTEISQPKVNSVVEEIKTPNKRAVEKKDASTGQDSDLIANYFAQQPQNSSNNISVNNNFSVNNTNHQSIQNSVQITSNNVSQQNGSIAVLADLNRQDISKQPPQKAIVKPQILTHVIDGYIIQESPNPFPVNGLPYNSDPKSLNDEKNNSIESLKSKNKNENSLITNASSSARIRTGSEPHPCLNCGQKRKANSKSKKSKRFCGSKCANEFKTNNDKNLGTNRLTLYNSVTSHLENNEFQKGQEFSVESAVNETEKSTHEEKKRLKTSKKSHENTNDSSSTKNGDINVVNLNARKASTSTEVTVERTTPAVNSDFQSPKVVDESSTSSAVAGIFIPPGGKNPLKWSVQDVYEFVRNLQGCTEYADEFRSQEIDGQALMLLKEDHLMSAMNMKLGPALKICNKINALREDVQKQN